MRIVVLLLAVTVLASSRVLAADLVPLPGQPDGVPWPTRAWPQGAPEADVDAEALDALFEQAFTLPDLADPPGTRAALVIHRGRLVKEQYAEGFAPDQRFLSQSVAKSVTNTLVGILVRQGKLKLEAPAPVPQWKTRTDPRRDITLDDLLQMSSGLEFTESYFNPLTSDALPMLFGEYRKDMAAFAASKPLVHEPGTHFAYSSGTTNLVSGIVKQQVGGTGDDYLRFMKKELFQPLGLDTAVPEFDGSGTFVGSSWLHMSARDWARFGYLYLRDGVWAGNRILPEGWVDYSRRPHTNSVPRDQVPYGPDNTGIYGAHFWLNAGNPEAGIAPRISNAPSDLFMGSGHKGQFVVIVPSHDLVIVRFGRTGYLDYGKVHHWIGEIISAFPQVVPEPTPAQN